MTNSSNRAEDVSLDDVPLSGPDLGPRERELVGQVLDGQVLSMGPLTLRFEDQVAGYVGRRFGIAVNSGTSGLHLCVIANEIGPGDAVVTSPFSFVASSNSILYTGGVPVFVDIDPHTFNIDPAQVREALAGRGGAAAPPKAIMPVHVFGQPCEMRALEALAATHGCRIIEDACEAIGSEYLGRRTGTFGACGVFAFYPNKQMTTGEGGMIVTDDEQIAEVCRSLRNQGRDEQGTWLNHVRLGYNYRLDEMSAALGVAQFERLDELIDRRSQVASWYDSRLQSVPGIRVPEVASTTTRMSWFVYVIRLDPKIDREGFMREAERRGLHVRPYFTPIHLQPFYRERFGFTPGMFPVTEALAQTTLAVPFRSGISEEQVDRVCRVVRSILA